MRFERVIRGTNISRHYLCERCDHRWIVRNDEQWLDAPTPPSLKRRAERRKRIAERTNAGKKRREHDLGLIRLVDGRTILRRVIRGESN